MTNLWDNGTRRLTLALAIGLIWALPAYADHADDCATRLGTAGITACSAAIASAPDNALLYIYRAIHSVKVGRFQDAHGDLADAIRLNPRHAMAYRLRGKLYYMQTDLDRASEDLKVAVSLDPTDYEPYLLQGMIHLDRGLFREAVEAFTTAIERRPRLAEAYGNRGIALAYYHRGRARMRSGQIKSAIADYSAAAELDTQISDALVWRADAYRALGERTRAMADIDAVLRVRPTDTDALNIRGVLLLESNNSAALADFSRVLAIDPTHAAATVNLCLAQSATDQLEATVRSCTVAIERFPAHPRLLLYRGTAHLRAHRYDDAASDFERLLAEQPQNNAALYGRAYARKMRGEAGAVEEVSRLSRDPDVINRFAPFGLI